MNSFDDFGSFDITKVFEHESHESFLLMIVAIFLKHLYKRACNVLSKT